MALGFDDIVITGVGCVTPLGIGRPALEQQLLQGVSGTRAIFNCPSGHRVYYGAAIDNFDGKDYVTPRKALKLMGREVQLAYSAAHLAWEDARLTETALEPERVGVVFGSEMLPGDISEVAAAIDACKTDGQFDARRWGSEFSKHIFPLWMLRYLPNMPPCHVAIAIDARGPNNTIALEEVSGLLALGEAIGIMQRGDADLMVVGGLGERISPTRLAYRLPDVYCEQSGAVDDNYHSRAFDARRAGIVPSEAAVVVVLERRRHAVARKAHIYAHVRSVVSRFGRPVIERRGSKLGIELAVSHALQAADISADDLACVSAQGFSQQQLDQTEAQAVATVLPGTPVTALSSYFGTAGAASGLLQLTAAMLATGAGHVLPTLGYQQADPTCPVDVVRQMQPTSLRHVLQSSFTFHGQAAAVVLEC
ncbi:MAG: hypothetical protein KF752_02710 [Pirellulaceae bacterium]|nr:hypothetical protein [Pirellulaceae bacterium]